MILIDLNQCIIANLMAQIGSNPNTTIEPNLIRHMVLNSLRSYVKQFKYTYGPEIVICCDSKHYWRKTIFPHYKGNRKKHRTASKFDWKTIFDTIDLLKAELKEFFPYKVIEVETAEADDIIAVLTEKYCPHEKVLILSGDHDFLQLQQFKNVYQYTPMFKKYLKEKDPQAFLKEHIIRGDSGDGIPNILSADDTFVTEGGRQRPINSKKVALWLKEWVQDFCDTDTMKHGWHRNSAMIDLAKIPDAIKENIIETFDNAKTAPRNRLLSYMISKRLKNLIDCLSEF